jgi:xanthine/CO dehydrogenase XdhC/CoxF family maturation factor
VTPEEIAVAIVAEAIQIRRVGFKHPMSKKLYQNSHS